MSVGETLIDIAVAAGLAAAGAIIDKLLPDQKDRDVACALLAKRLAFRAEAQKRLDERKKR